MTKDEAILTLAQCREVVADPQSGLFPDSSKRLTEALGRVLGWLEEEPEGSTPWRPCSREFAIENREHCEYRVRCNDQPDEWYDWESCYETFGSLFNFTALDYQFRTNLPPAETPKESDLYPDSENSDWPVDFCEY